MSVEQGRIFVEGIGTNLLVLSVYRGVYTMIYIPSLLKDCRLWLRKTISNMTLSELNLA